jgi:hypothetical protein
MKLIEEGISRAELREMAQGTFGSFVKAVVDVERGVMAVDAPMHSDEEAELLRTGSRQENLWGINLYPDEADDAFVEFDSMINLRPSQDNRSRGVDSAEIRESITRIVGGLVQG